MIRWFIYLFLGILFGIILTKSEVISWYRIQEMFRFQSFHMYGIIGSAIFTGMVLIGLLKLNGGKAIDGTKIDFPKKVYNHGYIIGGSIFGMGWAMTGACPGPLFALVGAGVYPVLIIILFALIGTWVYSYFRPNLPH
ncbi:MAG: YeeE/YedE family protein [Chitinophagaceae bacterium]|nr:MAG: YeeE/YedE family protein [Chitinophagaceae bacterium]